MAVTAFLPVTAKVPLLPRPMLLYWGGTASWPLRSNSPHLPLSPWKAAKMPFSRDSRGMVSVIFSRTEERPLVPEDPKRGNNIVPKVGPSRSLRTVVLVWVPLLRVVSRVTSRLELWVVVRTSRCSWEYTWAPVSAKAGGDRRRQVSRAAALQTVWGLG